MYDSQETRFYFRTIAWLMVARVALSILFVVALGALALSACHLGGDPGRCPRSARHRRPADPSTAASPQVIPLKHVRAGELAHTLASLGRRTSRGRELRFTDLVRIAPFDYANALLVVGNPVDVATLRTLVASLDVPRRRVRLQVSLVEGQLAPEMAGDLPADRGGRPTGRHRLASQRVLDTTPLFLADGEEQPLPLSPGVAKEIRCLWGEGPPRLSVSTRLGPGGRVEIALHSNAPGRARPRPARRGSLVLSVALRRTAAVAFVPDDRARGLGPGFHLAEPSAEGFVVPSRCSGAQARTHLLVITPTLVDG